MRIGVDPSCTKYWMFNRGQVATAATTWLSIVKTYRYTVRGIFIPLSYHCGDGGRTCHRGDQFGWRQRNRNWVLARHRYAGRERRNDGRFVARRYRRHNTAARSVSGIVSLLRHGSVSFRAPAKHQTWSPRHLVASGSLCRFPASDGSTLNANTFISGGWWTVFRKLPRLRKVSQATGLGVVLLLSYCWDWITADGSCGSCDRKRA